MAARIESRLILKRLATGRQAAWEGDLLGAHSYELPFLHTQSFGATNVQYSMFSNADTLIVTLLLFQSRLSIDPYSLSYLPYLLPNFLRNRDSGFSALPFGASAPLSRQQNFVKSGSRRNVFDLL